MSARSSEWAIRMLALLPFVFALFFTVLAGHIWHEVRYPEPMFADFDFQLMSVGVGLLETTVALVCWALTIGLASGKLRPW